MYVINQMIEAGTTVAPVSINTDIEEYIIREWITEE